MVKWVIIYSDGTEFTSDDGHWRDAPGRSAQVILFRDREGTWQIRHGGDYFRLDGDGTVVSMSESGMIDHVVHDLGVVKQGKMLSLDHWNRVYQLAKARCAELNDGPAIR